MSSLLDLAIAVAAGVGFVAAFAYIDERRLRKYAGTPGFAERLQLRRGRNLLVTIGLSIVLLVMIPSDGVETGGRFSLPIFACFVILLSLAAVLGGFPNRRFFFEESWGMGAFLGFQLRFLATFAGFILSCW